MLLPTVSLGPHQITRLIIGGNPFSGGSHVSADMDKDFVDYYSNENIKKALFECERSGLNTMQSRGDRHIRRMINEYRNDGGTLQWIAQTASEFASLPANVQQIAAAGAIAIYHHGARTDNLWRDGRIDEVQELLKLMRDLGVQVGLGTHIPEVIEYSEERGWDVDFYMACVYNLSRERRESAVTAGPSDREGYLDEDRDVMCGTIRQTPKPCLACKILAASRNTHTPEALKAAFEHVFQNIKPTDAVIAGIFQKYKNQVAENAEIVRSTLAEAEASPFVAGVS